MKRTIAPLDQAGSWQLEDYLIIVEKGKPSGAYNKALTYRVQVVQMEPYDVAYEDVYLADSPCGAAVLSLVRNFGASSREAKEFTDHYPCPDPLERQRPQQRKMKLSLDGVQSRVPKWARPPRG